MALAFFRRGFRIRHMAWLLALALWLPAAQWAVAAHALLHLDAAQSEHRDGQPSPLQSCNMCVVAATLGGAAPPPSSLESIAPPVAPHAQPLTAGSPAAVAAPLPAYRSRAPPFLHA